MICFISFLFCPLIADWGGEVERIEVKVEQYVPKVKYLGGYVEQTMMKVEYSLRKGEYLWEKVEPEKI